MTIRKLDFFVGGYCATKTDNGGWCVVCMEDNFIIENMKGFEPFSTNNRMELKAFLTALEILNTVATSHAEINLYTHNSNLEQSINNRWYLKWLANGWKTADRQDIKNKDLWAPILALYIKLNKKYKINIIRDVPSDKEQWMKYVKLEAIKAKDVLDKGEQ